MEAQRNKWNEVAEQTADKGNWKKVRRGVEREFLYESSSAFSPLWIYGGGSWNTKWEPT